MIGNTRLSGVWTHNPSVITRALYSCLHWCLHQFMTLMFPFTDWSMVIIKPQASVTAVNRVYDETHTHTHLCDVVHDRDLKLQVHKTLVRIRDLIVQHVLKEQTHPRVMWWWMRCFSLGFMSVLPAAILSRRTQTPRKHHSQTSPSRKTSSGYNNRYAATERKRNQLCYRFVGEHVICRTK